MFLQKILEKRPPKPDSSLPDWRRLAQNAPPPRDFRAALRSGDAPRVIAEFKRASPSKGILRADLDPVRQARAYQAGGACAISVLTEEHFFQGSGEDLQAVRAACDLPVLRKDFLQEEWEIYQARAWGADALLLIAAILEPSRLRELMDLTHGLGMQALVEVHSSLELESCLELSPPILGINNRDLKTFHLDLAVTRELCARRPSGSLCVSESGFFEAHQLASFPEVDAFLIGESLVRSEDPCGELRQLRGISKHDRRAGTGGNS